MSQTFYSLV